MYLGSSGGINDTGDDQNCSLPDSREEDVLCCWGTIVAYCVQPVVCVFGIVGNLLNLTILTRRKLQKSFRTLEHSANLCLISLAVSDLMFCIFVFLTAFLPVNFLERDSFFYYYARYSYAVINVFIMESTMLTVAMSLERYMAICHPLRQDLYLTTRRIKYIIVYTYVFSVLFNLPVWWRFEPVTVCAANASIVIPEDGNLSCPCVAADFRPFNSTHSSGFSSAFSSSPPLSASIGVPQPSRYLYRHRRVPLYGSHVAEVSYRIAWAVVGNYVPLLLLVYFNFCLCRKIYRSYTRRKHLGRMDQPRSSSHILTVTLVAIVVLFFILVAPTETIIHVMEMSNSEESSSSEAILNLMQTINFSVNFILYCIISPYFRKTLKYMVLCGCYNIYQVSRNWKKEFETSLM